MGTTINNIEFLPPQRILPPFSWLGHIPFAQYLSLSFKPKVFVELGVHTGNSYNAFCQYFKHYNIESKCFGVDTWQGEEHAGFYDDDIFNSINEHNKKHFASFSTLVRKSFDEASAQFETNSIDLLHIDGLHTYEAVKHDFETWLPKMSNRGIIIFHDTNVRENNFGVWKLWEELSGNYPGFQFTHSHGLGVLFVGNDKSDPTIGLIEKLSNDSGLVYKLETLGRGLYYQYAEDEIKRKDLIIENNKYQLINLDQQVKDHANTIKKYESSLSWKLTKPFRLIHSLLFGKD